jgi:hypothetical protein
MSETQHMEIRALALSIRQANKLVSNDVSVTQFSVVQVNSSISIVNKVKLASPNYQIGVKI